MSANDNSKTVACVFALALLQLASYKEYCIHLKSIPVMLNKLGLLILAASTASRLLALS